MLPYRCVRQPRPLPPEPWAWVVAWRRSWGTQGDFGKDWRGGSQGGPLEHAFCYVVKSDDCDCDDQSLHLRHLPKILSIVLPPMAEFGLRLRHLGFVGQSSGVCSSGQTVPTIEFWPTKTFGTSEECLICKNAAKHSSSHRGLLPSLGFS